MRCSKLSGQRKISWISAPVSCLLSYASGDYHSKVWENGKARHVRCVQCSRMRSLSAFALPQLNTVNTVINNCSQYHHYNQQATSELSANAELSSNMTGSVEVASCKTWITTCSMNVCSNCWSWSMLYIYIYLHILRHNLRKSHICRSSACLWGH